MAVTVWQGMEQALLPRARAMNARLAMEPLEVAGWGPRPIGRGEMALLVAATAQIRWQNFDSADVFIRTAVGDSVQGGNRTRGHGHREKREKRTTAVWGQNSNPAFPLGSTTARTSYPLLELIRSDLLPIVAVKCTIWSSTLIAPVRSTVSVGFCHMQMVIRRRLLTELN
jgi:hypothetical protein